MWGVQFSPGRDHGARSITLGWLGTSLAPGQLVEFCKETLVIRVAGIPPISTVKAPVKCLDGPMTVPEATPMATPELSPFVMGIVVPRLWTGIHMISTFTWDGMAVGPIATLGYGIGTGDGDGGAGVKHTSGKPISVPIICVLANIEILLTHVNPFSVYFNILFCGQHGVFSPQRQQFFNEVIQSPRP